MWFWRITHLWYALSFCPACYHVSQDSNLTSQFTTRRCESGSEGTPWCSRYWFPWLRFRGLWVRAFNNSTHRFNIGESSFPISEDTNKEATKPFRSSSRRGFERHDGSISLIKWISTRFGAVFNPLRIYRHWEVIGFCLLLPVVGEVLWLIGIVMLETKPKKTGQTAIKRCIWDLSRLSARRSTISSTVGQY